MDEGRRLLEQAGKFAKQLQEFEKVGIQFRDVLDMHGKGVQDKLSGEKLEAMRTVAHELLDQLLNIQISLVGFDFKRADKPVDKG